ncbi:MAG: hypothetical protein Q9186_001586 [Xanthomendoza sp. 1 TL-2023]
MFLLQSLWIATRNLFYSGAIGTASYFNEPEPPPLSLWTFKPDGTGSGTWAEEISEEDPFWDGFTRSTFGYQDSGAATAYVLGGVVADTAFQSPDDILLPGLLEFDMKTRTFTNWTSTIFNANGTGSGGQMHFVPFFGPNGIFLIMGGRNGWDPHYGFDNIWIYEGVTHKWYNQTASGNVPAGRSEFCVAGVNSSNSTYEIFLYGGHQGDFGPSAVPFDEIFILTLPAWHWLKVDYPPQYPRGDHSCNAVGGSQVISIGGYDANSKIFYGDYNAIRQSMFNSTADPFAQGLGIFNMTSLAWEDHYTANAPPYEQSNLVKTFYRDNPQDGSQFSTAGLKELFQTTHFTPADTAGSPDSNSTPTNPAQKPNSSSSDTGAIAGGAVGGVVGFACIAATFLIIWRRLKRRTSKKENNPPGRRNYNNDGVTSTTPEIKAPTVHSLQEADATTPYRCAQLDGQEIQELQQHPVEMAVSTPGEIGADSLSRIGPPCM